MGIMTLTAVTAGVYGYAALDGFQTHLLDLLAAWAWFALLFCLATIALGRVRRAWHFLIWPTVTLLTLLMVPHVANAYASAMMKLSLRTGYEFEISEAFGTRAMARDTRTEGNEI